MINGIAHSENRITKRRERKSKIYLASFPFHFVDLNFMEKILKSEIIR
jgi:hypothetical protein